MKTRILPLIALAAALCGCPHENEASVQWFAVCFPPAPDSTSGGCIFPSSCEAVALGTFYAYVDSIYEAVAPIEIRNQLPDNTDLTSGRLNTNVAYIEQFRLEFGGTALPDEWVDTNVTVPTDGSTVALVPLLPPNTTFFLTTLLGGPGQPTFTHLMVSVRAAGRFADERTFVTGPFKVPVDVYDAPPCPPPVAGSVCYSPPDCDPVLAGIQAPLACPQLGQSAIVTCP